MHKFPTIRQAFYALIKFCIKNNRDIKSTLFNKGEKTAPKLLEYYTIHQENNIIDILENVITILNYFSTEKREIKESLDEKDTFFIYEYSNDFYCSYQDTIYYFSGLIKGILNCNYQDCTVRAVYKEHIVYIIKIESY